MILENFYAKIGGNYNEVLERLLSEKRITSFVIRFLDDNSFETLCQYLDNKDYDSAFNSAHNLKGLAQNLGFTKLAKSSEKLRNALRSDNQDVLMTSHTLINDVIADYKEVKVAIKKLKKQLK